MTGMCGRWVFRPAAWGGSRRRGLWRTCPLGLTPRAQRSDVTRDDRPQLYAEYLSPLDKSVNGQPGIALLHITYGGSCHAERVGDVLLGQLRSNPGAGKVRTHGHI